MPYVYGGTKRQAPRKPRAPRPEGYDPAKCGTYAGYVQHKRRGTPVCDPCRAACNKYHLTYYHAHRTPTPPRPVGIHTPGVCGTRNGYARHQRNDTTPCTECRAANTAHAIKYKAQRAANAARAQRAAERSEQ